MSRLNCKINNNILSVVYFLIVLFVSLPSAFAGMEAMDDAELDSVNAGTGLGIMIKDMTFSYQLDNYTYFDTDTGNSLALNNISYHDGLGGPVYLDTGDEGIIFDLFTIDDLSSPMNGATFFAVSAHDWHQDYHYSVDNVVFAGTDIGSFDTGNIDLSSFDLYLTPGGRGLAFEFDFQMRTDEKTYTYSDAGDNLTATGITWSQTAAGLPEDPATWTFSGSFAIGDINNANPATMDVLTLTDNGITSILMNTPMRGSIRVNNVNFGGTDFGPIAIDGINMHHFHVMIKPGFL